MMDSRIQQLLPLAPPRSPSSRNIDNFCNDCGVMFESNTSLQVHLTYHKENLSRWVPTGQNPPPQLASPSTQTKMEPKNESVPPSSSPHFVTQPHFSQNFPHFGQPIHFLPPQQNQFSPLHFDEGRMGPRVVKDRSSAEHPSEILDLDSNRVHLYNIQQEQSFYRPYLMSQPPPSGLPPAGNGWSQQAPPPEAHYATNIYSQEMYVRNPALAPPVTVDGHGGPGYNNYVVESNYGPPPVVDQQPIPFQPQQPPAQPPVVHRQQREVPSPAAQSQPNTPTVKKANRPVESSVAAPEFMRGKGKGGACKRPKAYECTSCNKWFTSSGHLKRHYGTTLHKNSAQQNGTEGMEPAVGPGRGKGKKSKKLKMDELSNASSLGAMESQPTSRPTSTPSNELILPTNGDIGGVSTDRPIPPMQYAPPSSMIQQQHQQIPQPAYLYLGNSQLLTPQSHSSPSPFMSHFDPTPGSIYNSHSLPLPSIYNTAVGYPIMEVPLQPFSSTQYSTEVTNYAELNGNGHSSANGNTSPEPIVKKEEPEESPEVGRGIPRSPTSWLSPDEGSLENGSLSSSSSGHDSGETQVDLQGPPLDHGGSLEGKEVPKQLIQCPNCTKTFTRTCYLTQHKNSSHSPEGRPFKCPLCGKKFSVEPALSEHVSKHGGNKPYKCSLCPKDFNHKTDLRRHLQQHTGTMPFTCSECGKGFVRKDHMMKHTEIHRKNPYRTSHIPTDAFVNSIEDQ